MHTSTYRLQIHRDWPLDSATDLVPYLRSLGVGAAYLSPVFAAVPGSLHGYDVCDPTQINPELGGEEAFERLTSALKEKGLGCLLDIVPNHMSADPLYNRWWWEVLEKGPDSPHASFFDIDWNAQRIGGRGKVLLPVLGTPYGEALRNGELRVEQQGETYVVRYFDSIFPLNAASLAWAFPENPAYGPTLEERLRTLDVHALLEKQFYRLSNWKTALHEANYRRFFDVSTLLGVRMESEEVFEASHDLLRRFLQSDRVTGVRVDHIDGLRDPGVYLTRLQQLLEKENPARAPYLLVEKILQEDELLPAEWPVNGTTGYEFLSDLNGLFIPSAGLESLRATAIRFQGGVAGSDEETECKRLVLSRIMRSELNLLTDRLNDLSMEDLSARDFTRDDLRIAVRDTLAALSIYRTYGRDGYLAPFDARAFESAVAEAARANPWMDPHIFVFLRNVFFSFVEPAEGSPLESIPRRDRLNFALRFQQTSGAVTAKGVEDTFFYRHPVLLSLHEVGSSPRLCGTSVARFHARMAIRRRDYPLGMLATSTHDAKRGEDARARLNALAGRAGEWRRVLAALAKEMTGPRHRAGLARQDEHYLYQSLLGAWPMEGTEAAGESLGKAQEVSPAPVDEEFMTRLEGAWIKAVREAKLRTNWVKPDEEYERGVHEFLEDLLRGPSFPAFSHIFFPTLVACARDGTRLSLAQVACKCAVPGVPDVYQGSEFWDLSLVDPDNRRPVDFTARRAALEEVASYLDPDGGPAPEDRATLVKNLMDSWPDGRIKQYVLARCLRWRERHPDLFLNGSYEPLETTGSGSGETLAFRRASGNQGLIGVIPLRAKPPGIGMVLLPPEEVGRTYVHVFTGKRFTVTAKGKRAGLDLGPLYEEFPAAWLFREV